MLTLEVLESKLLCVFMSPENDKLKFIADSDSIDFFSVDSAGYIEHVVFSLESNKENELLALLMSRTKYTQMEEKIAEKKEVINTKIKSLRFSYLNRDEYKWYETWPEELELPQEVKIEAGFQDGTGKLFELVKYINIPLANTLKLPGYEKL